jgi:hypothetical protein
LHAAQLASEKKTCKRQSSRDQQYVGAVKPKRTQLDVLGGAIRVLEAAVHAQPEQDGNHGKANCTQTAYVQS